jgi:flagellar basal-body rod modification protein FlgD
LLVTQLQNQNPLDPMDETQMAEQLSSLSQLEQLENQTGQLAGMQEDFKKVLLISQRSQAANLIGKTVSFYAEDEYGSLSLHSGKVESVDLAEEEIRLKVGEYAIGLDAIQTIEDSGTNLFS